jgi:hypothetical protein
VASGVLERRDRAAVELDSATPPEISNDTLKGEARLCGPLFESGKVLRVFREAYADRVVYKIGHGALRLGSFMTKRLAPKRYGVKTSPDARRAAASTAGADPPRIRRGRGSRLSARPTCRLRHLPVGRALLDSAALSADPLAVEGLAWHPPHVLENPPQERGDQQRRSKQRRCL